MDRETVIVGRDYYRIKKVIPPSAHVQPWYRGETLTYYLEAIPCPQW